ncbi:helix-turn-helix transcriptional regulator [Paenalkalicoccus suaedae]|uniref:Helix-turn-helix transcriptional regulator n=1 Tax=Paenalkalicoccus suaedae TaxID=2592382 RepID=A0A859FDH6_9BACI|nr:helix-turn-helix transcriptional regulator [Paenalkalicoccus suaedae]QKS70898.1 helix-turn-helix transcriptional regulator [Paenalkalicoccus suaedae]
MIGDMIRSERKQKGWTLSQLSRKTGVSKSYLSYLERDKKKNPSIVIVKRIFMTLEIPMEDLLQRLDEHSVDQTKSKHEEKQLS